MKMGVFRKPEEVDVKDWMNEEDFYSEEARILLTDDDEMSTEESGFMQGYEEAEE
jgi:hypothetical protein